MILKNLIFFYINFYFGYRNVNETIKNGDIDERKNISSKLPVKKFKWTEETRLVFL